MINIQFVLSLVAFVSLLADWSTAQDRNARTSIAERFKRLDRNGDGKLTQEEIPRLFKQLDANNDGQVTLNEANAFYASGRRTGAGSGQGQQTPSVPMKVVRDIPYAKIEDAAPNLTSIDIYAPEKAADCPVMIWVHGGAWQKGDKGNIRGLSDAFVREGFVLVSTNYRLAPKDKFPAQPEDVAAAIAWVYKHATEYGGDPGRLFLMGHSAGAHLVALLATDESYLQKNGLTLKALSAVVPLDTEAYNLEGLAERFGGKLPDTWGVPFGQDPVAWAKASPIAHVKKGKGIPPMIVAYSGGMKPNSNPNRAKDAEEFVKALTEAGVTAEIIGAPEKTHAQIASEFGQPGDHVAEKIFAFIRKIQGNKP
ncbi:MAG: alpha/beta hydrolase fold domain-containing protein [Planctomycetota bacterium]